jgi:hypothetical protein
MATKYKVPQLDTIQGGINAFDDLADTIANPPADKPLRQAIGQSGRLYCDFVGSSPGEAILPWTGQGLVAPLLCKPYWDSQGYDAPVSTPPFTGGQCADGYEFVIKSQGNASPLADVFANSFTRGPITGWRVENVGGRTKGYVTSNSIKAASCGAIPAAQGSAERLWFDVLERSREVPFTAQVLSVCPGGSNNCGDPDGVLEPGTNPPPTPTFPPGEEPGFEPDGQPFFFVPPIDSPIGGDPIPVPPQPEPDPGPPGDDTPTNPGEAGDPEETSDGGECSGCAPAGSELTGVFIEIVDFPENAARFQNNSRQPFRGAGYIAMGWEDLLGVDMSGGVINLEQFFHAQQRGITCWRVTANIGFNLRCTPYYRELNPEEDEEG